jgi:hypothetical protein
MYMKAFISKESQVNRVFSDKQTFFAAQIDLPEELTKSMLAYEDRYKTYQMYLRKLEGLVLSRAQDMDLTTVEVPECLETQGAAKEEQPKQKATEATSNSKSQSKRKKTQSKSSTSRKKAE